MELQTNGDHIPDQIISLQKKKVGSTVTSKTHTMFHLTNGETTRTRAGAGEGVAKNTFSRFLPTYYVAKSFYGLYIWKFSIKVRPTKTSTGCVSPFARRMILWFCVHLANCGFSVFLVWRKFTRNEELFAPLQLVMTPIGSAFIVWNHMENIIVWFGYHEITFQVY